MRINTHVSIGIINYEDANVFCVKLHKAFPLKVL